ncbi:histidine kinase [Streptomyces ipomoeae]|uniref:Histidine kinase n=1 Tax=Streptomyces ipomoeae TaxID=103232 RepID=A0AAE8VWL4_9ACTN|nr:ATP-binding protein [Streptomyces ipomoeae]TQE24568.1 histidine kinase [Streptomyces ipomoeae]TQE35062.1 histidine kinase [Streptomyces ipomoeae]
MVKVRLETSREHVAEPARLRDPVGAVEELIWNALDADAEHVVVTLERNDLGGVDRVRVQDDGSGMSAEHCEEYFRPIGTSWKKHAQGTPAKNRALHGKNGRGRVRAFALGTQVRWTSVSESAEGRRQLLIEADRHSMDEFDIGDAEPTDEPPGTLFEAFGGNELDVLGECRARSSLTTAFAAYLERYPDVRIAYDGHDLDPASEQLHVRDYVLPSPTDSTGEPARLKVVEWRRPVTRALFLCDGEGMSRAQLKPGIQAPGFEFTAHLTWSGFDDVDSEDLAFTDWAADGPLAEVLAAARDQLRSHFRARVDERRREQVAEWQKEGIYPYAGDAADERERAERETFDAVATTVFRHLPKSQGTRRTTFALLRSVLAHEPSDILRIADELFTLSRQEREELNRLLTRTTLSALIKASTAAANRIDFLTALEHLVFAPEAKPRVQERDELHRILEDQCWVFGEEYALHVSDRSLNAVLAQHCRLLGRDAPTPEPVLREDGRTGRVDLMLSRAARHRKGERHHLIIELKRPSVILGMVEFSQISSYAEAVMSDDRFRDPAVTWDFWLVGNTMDKALRQLAHQVDRVPGCAVSTPRFRIMVKTWGEIIEDCQERLRFHSAQLEYQSSTEHAMDYLVRNHGEAVAELVADGTIPTARSAAAAVTH